MTKINKLFDDIRKFANICSKYDLDSTQQLADDTDTWSDDDPLTNPFAGTDEPSIADIHADQDVDTVDEDWDLVDNAKNTFLNDLYNFSRPFYDKIKDYFDDINVNDINTVDSVCPQIERLIAKKGIDDTNNSFPNGQEFYQIAHKYVGDALNKRPRNQPYLFDITAKDLVSDTKLANYMPNIIHLIIKFEKSVSAGNAFSIRGIKHAENMLKNPCLKRLVQKHSGYDNQDRYECFKMLDWASLE